jgi:hypothetical protein
MNLIPKISNLFGFINNDNNNNNNNNNNIIISNNTFPPVDEDHNELRENITLEIKLSIANAINSGNKYPEELAQFYKIKRARINYIARKIRLGKNIRVSSGRPTAIDNESNQALIMATLELRSQSISSELFRKKLRQAIKLEYLNSYNRRHKLQHIQKIKVPPITIRRYIEKYKNYLN